MPSLIPEQLALSFPEPKEESFQDFFNSIRMRINDIRPIRFPDLPDLPAHQPRALAQDREPRQRMIPGEGWPEWVLNNDIRSRRPGGTISLHVGAVPTDPGAVVNMQIFNI
jgi:hypothetical protein